jgi:hypothetical protein
MLPVAYEQISKCLDAEALLEARLWSCKRHIQDLTDKLDAEKKECWTYSRRKGKDNEKRHVQAIANYDSLRGQITVLQNYGLTTHRELMKLKEITRATLAHLSLQGA